MRKVSLIITAVASILWAAAHDVLTLHFKDGSQVALSLEELVSVVFTEESITTTGQERTYRRSDIESITFDQTTDPEPPSPGDETTKFTITWQGTEATVVGSHPDVEVSSQGGVVTITNSNTTDEFTYVLSGTGQGAFVLNGDYKATIELAGLSLTGTGYGAAIDVKSGKRTALVVADGTENSLSDADLDLGQKAALYCKGHLEVSGGGTLRLTGKVKHALSTKEYLQLKKTAGTIEVLAAAGDGFHAGQYFKMNGGQVVMKSLGGDGIQAEATSNTTDEQNGELIINGGSLDITLTANDAAVLKSDSLMTITGGTASITTSGAGDKGMKSKTTFTMEGGDFTITQAGKPYVVDGDVAYVSAIKADAVTLTGGNVKITNSVVGGRGISCSGNVVTDGTANVEMTLTGNGGTAADAVEGSGDGSTAEPEADYRVYVNLPTSSQGGGGPGGGGSRNNAWSAVALYKSDGTLVKPLTQQVTANGTTFYVCDFQKADNDTYYFGNPNGYQSSSYGGGTTYTIRTSTFNGPSDGLPHFYKAASSYSSSGTTRTYQLSDVTSSYRNATIGSSSSSDGFTAKGIKAEGDCQLLGGTINIKMSGTGAKGMKVEGNYTQGRADGTGPTLTVATTGSSYGSSSGSSWGGGGGRPGESSGSSSKAMKIMGTALVQGGQSEVTTASDGAEGLETKVAQAGSIRFTGGQHYYKCYDDCLNSAGGITFDGGVVVCYSNGNDAVDSNYGRSGAIVIGNGAILAYSSKGSPEEGLDCDNNSYIQITGNGYAVSLGGSQGGGGGWGGSSSGIGSATQGYGLVTTSASYAANRYYTLSDASGQNLLTFSVEASVSSSMSLFTAKGMTSNQSYTVKYNTTTPTDATTSWHGLYLGSSATGTTSTTSFTAK